MDDQTARVLMEGGVKLRQYSPVRHVVMFPNLFSVSLSYPYLPIFSLEMDLWSRTSQMTTHL